MYEELGAQLRDRGGSFPVRADDDFVATLGMDPEEIDEVAERVALRSGRSLDGAESNPMFGSVKTPRELVAFFMAQPLAAAVDH